jgi:hypothetical protein
VAYIVLGLKIRSFNMSSNKEDAVTVNLSGNPEAPDTPPVPSSEAPDIPVGEELEPLDDDLASEPHIVDGGSAVGSDEGEVPQGVEEVPLVDLRLQHVIARSIHDLIKVCRSLDNIDGMHQDLRYRLTSEAEKFTCRTIADHTTQAMKRAIKRKSL